MDGFDSNKNLTSLSSESNSENEINSESDIDIYNKPLREFNLNDLLINKKGYFDSSISIFGARRTGKSTLLLDILYFLQKKKAIGRIAAITSTEMNKFFKQHLPDATIFNTDNVEATIDNILAFQKEIIENDPNDGMPRQYTLILDDFSWMRAFSIYNELFARVFTTGRHYNIAVIILVQSPTGAMNWVRSNSDFVFILHTQGGREKERLWIDHLSFLPRQEYASFIDKNTMDYNAIVVNKTDPYKFGMDTVFNFKSKNINIDNIKKRKKLGDLTWRKDIDSKKTKKKTKITQNIDFQAMDEVFERSKFGIEFKKHFVNL